MLFTSPAFLFAFLPLTLAIFRLVPPQLRHPILLAASLGFYAWGEPNVVPFATSVVGNFLAGLAIERSRTPAAARRVWLLAIAGNLALLVAYKYAHFLGLRVKPMRLPLGVSFFSFQAIAYVTDVYRRVVAAERRPLRYALYAALFPHLIAGPIVRYRDLAGQLDPRPIPESRFVSGVRRFIVGLGKKLLLANELAPTADAIFALPPGELSAGAAWLGLACYTLQIYFDFSGYSDMAIGLGRMFGFEFGENFRRPYAAGSLGDFWRRWHISLSRWLRDYLFIPLGGNRVGPWRGVANLLVTFAACGLWHGAGWNFVLWGVWHGATLALERAGAFRRLDRLGPAVRHGRVLLTVMLGWVLFRCATLGQGVAYGLALAGGGGGYAASAFLNREVLILLPVGVLACLPPVRWPRGECRALRQAFETAALGLLFAGALTAAVAGAYRPFIYFRF